jgi:adenylate cyclase
MEAEGLKRQLAAILGADVKGYSRLMGEDEPATVIAIKSCRQAISEIALVHSGRVVDSPEDNILVELLVQCTSVRLSGTY